MCFSTFWFFVQKGICLPSTRPRQAKVSPEVKLNVLYSVDCTGAIRHERLLRSGVGSSPLVPSPGFLQRSYSALSHCPGFPSTRQSALQCHILPIPVRQLSLYSAPFSIHLRLQEFRRQYQILWLCSHHAFALICTRMRCPPPSDAFPSPQIGDSP